MRRTGTIKARPLWPIALFALLGAGCAGFQGPRVDPTGEALFLAPGDPTPAAPVTAYPGLIRGAAVPPGGAVPPGAVAPAYPAPMIAPGAMITPGPGVSINPSEIIEPVGSEVIMIANVCDAGGCLLSGQRIEWLLAAGSAGQFNSPGDRGSCFDFFRGLPRKVNGNYAINTTHSSPVRLDRGTPTPVDDVVIQPGQSWVSITSATEGTSYVTAFAPGVPAWARRQQAGTIYWVDAQWTLPPPAINPVGSRHTFVTTLTRHTNGTPLVGWRVRYEIQGGPDAGFSPDGAAAVEVPTDALGQASAEIFQKQATAGTNQVAIQIIRPAEPGGRQLVLGAGTTQKTWTSSGITIRTTGPARAGLGATVTYRIDVTNPGGVAATEVVVSDDPPAGLAYMNSNPAANSSPSGQEWRFDELPAGQTRSIEVNFRVTAPGSLTYCASVAAANGQTAKDCATTSAESSRLDVQVTGPRQARVGDEVRYRIEVFNRGDGPLAGLFVRDQFDEGLEHASAASPIERNLNVEIPPGGSHKIAATFRVARAGELCQEVTVLGEGGLRASTRYCTTAIEPGAPLPAVPAVPPAREPFTPPITQPALPPAEPRPVTPQPEPRPATPLPSANRPTVIVRKTGPDRAAVGDKVVFTIEITNNGSATLRNVRIADNAELSLKPLRASLGSETVGGALQWTIDSLSPGRTERRQVECECLEVAAQACNYATVTVDGGASVGEQACLEIVAARGPAEPGLPARPPAPAVAGKLTLSVADEVDPVRVDGETVYDVVVANEAAVADHDVVLSVKLPPETTLVQLQAPQGRASRTGGEVRFDPIAEIRPGESVNYQIRVRADQPGKVQFQAEVTSQLQKKPVTARETTEILDRQ